MPPRKAANKQVEITSTRHKDKRTNIPTEELRDFVTTDETAQKTTLYPRDPTLDPQLVWRGKDAQDADPLAVPVVPIYIQEKVHPAGNSRRPAACSAGGGRYRAAPLLHRFQRRSEGLRAESRLL